MLISLPSCKKRVAYRAIVHDVICTCRLVMFDNTVHRCFGALHMDCTRATRNNNECRVMTDHGLFMLHVWHGSALVADAFFRVDRERVGQLGAEMLYIVVRCIACQHEYQSWDGSSMLLSIYIARVVWIRGRYVGQKQALLRKIEINFVLDQQRWIESYSLCYAMMLSVILKWSSSGQHDSNEARSKLTFCMGPIRVDAVRSPFVRCILHLQLKSFA